LVRALQIASVQLPVSNPRIRLFFAFPHFSRATLWVINAAQISGKLGKDAETMTTQGGKTVTCFSIASSSPAPSKRAIRSWSRANCVTGEYTDEKKVTRQTVEHVAQTILRIDHTKLGVADQGDATEPEA
jgi:single-stranded DNA-binding protein